MFKFLDLRPDERRATLWAALCYGCVLFSWFLVRPLREAAGIERGADRLPWLMMGTFAIAIALNPLFSRLLDKLPRRKAVRFVYRFVQLNLLLFWAAFLLLGDTAPGADGTARVWLGYGMYVWMSTFNLLMVSVFWSLCNETMPEGGTRRTFGPMAAGGTVGAFLGATCSKELTPLVDEPLHMLLLSIVLLEGAVFCVARILKHAPERAPESRKPDEVQPQRRAFEGSAFAGFRDLVRSPYALLILAYVGFHSVTGTWAYFIQGEIIEATGQVTGERVRRFATIDQLTQALTFLLQLFVVTRLVGNRGMTRTLAILPLVSAVGFVALALNPSYGVLLGAQAFRRAADYGLSKPSREMLFAVLTPEQKYKLKNLIDVAGYRFFDWLGALSQLGLRARSLVTSEICMVAIGLSVLWLALTRRLGRSYSLPAAATSDSGDGV